MRDWSYDQRIKKSRKMKYTILLWLFTMGFLFSLFCWLSFVCCCWLILLFIWKWSLIILHRSVNTHIYTHRAICVTHKRFKTQTHTRWWGIVLNGSIKLFCDSFWAVLCECECVLCEWMNECDVTLAFTWSALFKFNYSFGCFPENWDVSTDLATQIEIGVHQCA